MTLTIIGLSVNDAAASHNPRARDIAHSWLRKSKSIRALICVIALLAIASAAASATQTGTAASAEVVNVTPAMSTPALQSAMAEAPSGSTILFAAGTYSIANQIYIPCSGLQIAGPVGATPTAILAASYTGSDIFSYPGGCASPGSVQYLQFKNTGAVYFAPGNNSNFTFEHNLVTNLPSMLGNGGSEIGLFFDGTLATTLSNVLIEYNTFGDPASCTAVFATFADEGGYCAGIMTSQGTDQNITIEYNNFIHVEEGIHFNQLATYNPGGPNSVCISCTLEYNYILNYHRIGIEIQTSTPTNSLLLEHNVVADPLNSSWGTFAVSLACCISSFKQGTPGFSPALVFDDNVLIATKPVGSECPPMGVEFWGNGSQGTNSLIEGTFCNGYSWGYGAAPWVISNNYICGPNMASTGSHISNEENTTNAPVQAADTKSSSCAGTPSLAPSISPSGGSFSGSQVVTLSDTGPNTGIWYTTDGSVPVPGSGTAQLYTAPFIISNSTTVTAVGMWGAPNQPVGYPSGYGYTPSAAVTASFAALAQ
jgi:Chitobiase/beta-hexosaminidase C-terminal domain